MNNWWLFTALAVLSAALTAILHRYAVARRLLDVPNARSSHAVPTPRGGGVAIVITLFMALTIGLFRQEVPLALAASLGIAGGLVAVVGFLDDHGHIAARWRLLAHFLSALLALCCLGGLAPLSVGDFTIQPAFLRNMFGLLFLVWMVNLYNFMDGIDGLAALEAVTCCLSMCVLFALTGHYNLLVAPLSLTAAALGFLVWNFPPAKIFMGDAGSGFLGLVIGTLAIYSSWAYSSFFWAWCIVLGVFIVDATYTLIRRALRGVKVYEAHRSHAYQSASRHAGAHLPITIAVAAINIFWLLPIAAAVVYKALDGLVGVAIAYIPLVLLAIKFRAGAEEADG
jgi:Fuc2NAc and GlcNAc transferase